MKIEKSPVKAANQKFVFSFGDGRAEGSGEMKSELGGKGANLAEMTRIGLPVPPGFTIATSVCNHYHSSGQKYPTSLKVRVEEALAEVETSSRKTFGGLKSPLLVSVRSGARDSMPGMMDTILNLGLNDRTLGALAKLTENERFAWDSYRRFLQMYGDVVMGVQRRRGEEHDPFESLLEELKSERHGDALLPDTELTTEDLQELVLRLKRLIRERTGEDFPQDPRTQLWGAIGAVFGSWHND